MTLPLRHRTTAEQLAWLDQLDAQLAIEPPPDGEGPDMTRWRRMSPDARALVRSMMKDNLDERPLVFGTDHDYMQHLITEHVLRDAVTRHAYHHDPIHRANVTTLRIILTVVRTAMMGYGIPDHLCEAVLIRAIRATVGPQALALDERSRQVAVTMAPPNVAQLAEDLRRTFDLVDEHVAQITDDQITARLNDVLTSSAQPQQDSDR